ncbi:MAG: transcriptional repressor [Butyrivibrio sp.]|nr:transcriptional repressor [Butyrivibrio sp.]
MSSEQVIDRLKSNGCRITKQRKLIVDVIMGNNHTSCKDIYYQVMAKDNTIGMATVYRMIRVLEDIGVINRIDMIEINNDVKVKDDLWNKSV